MNPSMTFGQLDEFMNTHTEDFLHMYGNILVAKGYPRDNRIYKKLYSKQYRRYKNMN
jgi:hypothetical protein